MLTVQPTRGGEEKAYALTGSDSRAVNDQIGEAPLVVFVRPGRIGSAFSSVLDDGLFLISDASLDGTFHDRETASTWDPVSGRAIAGSLAGTRLNPLPTWRAFWYTISLGIPGVELHAITGSYGV